MRGAVFRRTGAALASLLLLLTGGCRSLETAASSSELITAEGYTAQEIYDYFAEIAFQSEYGGYRGRLCKWTGEIVCYIEGDYTEGEMDVLTDLAARLNTISGFPGVRMTAEKEAANFTISFIMQNELSSLFGPEANHCSGMSKFYWTKEGGEIVRAETGIASNITPMNAKASVICEEFLQALGLSSDSYAHPESVFYEGYNGALRPAEIDWALIELLYSESVSPGMEEADALPAVRSLLGLPEENPEKENEHE